MSEDDQTTKKIKVDIGRQPEIDSLHEELAKTKEKLEEKEALLQKSTLEFIEDLKTKLIKKRPELQDFIEVMSPEQIKELSEKINLTEPEHKSAPMGKASLTPPKGSPIGDKTEHEDSRKLLDTLYHTAYYDPKASVEEKTEAKKKIETLITSMFEGKSWNQLKRNMRTKDYHFQFQACPKCNSTIDLTKEDHCYNCQWKPKKGTLGRE